MRLTILPKLLVFIIFSGPEDFFTISFESLYHLNPDNALEHTNQKFINRFNYIEKHSIKVGKPLVDMTLEEMDQLWNEAKELEKEIK